MKKWFNFTYRYFAEPIFEVTNKLRQETFKLKNDGLPYRRHVRMYRYMLFSFILSPLTFFVLILVLGIVAK